MLGLIPQIMHGLLQSVNAAGPLYLISRAAVESCYFPSEFYGGAIPQQKFVEIDLSVGYIHNVMQRGPLHHPHSVYPLPQGF